MVVASKNAVQAGWYEWPVRAGGTSGISGHDRRNTQLAAESTPVAMQNLLHAEIHQTLAQLDGARIGRAK
jgi:hypothetical protein